MNHPAPLQPNPLPPRVQTLWVQALVSLLLSLTALVFGWQLGEQGHARLSSASQTSPALPELRPLAPAQPSLLGPDARSEALNSALVSRWVSVTLRPASPVHDASTDLLALGRMNLDGG